MHGHAHITIAITLKDLFAFLVEQDPFVAPKSQNDSLVVAMLACRASNVRVGT